MKNITTNVAASIFVMSIIGILGCTETQDDPTSLIATTTVDSKGVVDLVETIEPRLILDSVAQVYGEGDIVKDSNHALTCYAVKQRPGHSDLDKLATLVESYAAGYLPPVFDDHRMSFRDFEHLRVEVWCNAMIQNIEERVLSRAWELVQDRRNKSDYADYWSDQKWPNVARNSTEYVSGLTHDTLILDQVPGDRLSQHYERGDFELDVETWVACVRFFEDDSEEII